MTDVTISHRIVFDVTIELRTKSAIVMSNVTIKVVTSSFERARHGNN